MSGHATSSRLRWLACLIAVVGPVARASLARADIAVTRWTLRCAVIPNNGGESRLVNFNQVMSPFVNSHTLIWQGATNSASYDITFDSQQLDFRADTSVTAPGITGGGIFTSACIGNLQFTTTADVLFSIDSHMQYHLPPGYRAADYNVNLSGLSGVGYMEDGYSSSPVFGDPPAGEYAIMADNIRLPGGDTYSVNYSFSLSSLGGNPNLLSQMNGYIQFHIRRVPEPATGVLLLSGLALLVRRRRPGYE